MKIFKQLLALFLTTSFVHTLTVNTNTTTSVQEREQITISEEQHHQLQAVDKLCPPTAVVNGTCFIQAKDIRLTYDFVYKTDLNLVFDNTEVQCITTRMLPCDVHIQTQGKTQITVKNNSKVIGRQVLVDAPESILWIDDASMITTSGQSLNQNGTQVKLEYGAQFIAQGGACGAPRENYTVFGNFDMLPDRHNLQKFYNQIGSIGYEGDAETAGGGRIVLLLDSIKVTAWGAPIQANAKPFDEVALSSTYQLTGGSGGYIYIETLNKYLENELSNKFRIEAKGGTGTNGSYGGSGGVLIFDGGFSLGTTQVTASGGGSRKTEENQDGCGNGGAGTLFYRKDSKLIIDNDNKPTPKKTVITVHSQSNIGLTELDGVPVSIAEDILIDGGADVWIDSVSSHDLKINNLELTENTTLGLVTSNNKNFTMHIGGSMRFADNTLLDLSHINNVRLNATNWWTSYSLGNIMFGHILQISGGYVTINGNVNVTDRDYQNRYDSKFIVNAEMLRLHGHNQTLETSFFFAHTHGPIWIDSGYNITSIIRQTCSAEYHVPKMFSCIPPKALNPKITFEDFMRNYDEQFGVETKEIEDTVSILAKGYLIYLMSENYIMMDESAIHAPRIGMCAPSIETRNVTIDAGERGCWGGHGIGKGWTHTNCSGGGGAHGSQGGYGMSIHGRRCDLNMPQPYSWGDEASYEGSSGGAPLEYLSSFGGNGGGIIWLISTGTIALKDTLVSVKGGDGKSFFPNKLGGGGGAGGSVNIVTKNIAGNAFIDASGGDGSLYGGGGGSGGRLIAHLIENYNSTNIMEQSLLWNGTISLAGGKGGKTGSMYQQEESHAHTSTEVNRTNDEVAGDGGNGTTRSTKCFGGFSGPFCKPCPVGTFKYNFGYGVCQPCTNKPEFSFYDNIGQASAVCSYQCNEGLESVEVNPHCVTSIDLQIERAGGSVSFLFVVAFFLMLSLILWMVIAARSTCIQKSHFDRYLTVYKDVLFTSDESDSLDDQEEAMISAANLNMKDRDIWSHVHRMYFIGENSISYPWYLTRDFPSNALTEQNKKKLLNFIKNEQWTLDWSKFDKFKYGVSRVLLPCCSDHVHRSLRRKHFRLAAEKVYRSFEPSDWENITDRTVRMSTDEGHRLGYLDFLDYRKNKKNYEGPKLPTTLLLAGNGTMESPYRLNFLDDPLAKSLVYLDKDNLKTSLPPFLQNLNSLLDKLDFFKFNRQTMKDLNDVIEWIDIGNKKLFLPIGVKMQLYVFENSYQEVVRQSGNAEAQTGFKQRRRSMPIENEVFEAFPALFKRLIQHIQLKLTTQHAEIRLGVVFKSVTQEQQQMMQSKMRRISESLNGQNQNILGFSRATMSELYNDEEDAQDFVPHQNQNASQRLGGINRSSEMSEALLDQTTSMVTIHATGAREQVQIIDKSKRAFDISFEATKLMEEKLQKEKKTCKHTWARFKTVVYSLFILLFKFHGSPPTARLNALFLLYSLFLSLELILSTVFFTHVVNPLSNMWDIGFCYLWILPGLTIIAPLFGLLATVCGSPRMMLIYSSMNATLAVLTYPLTMISLFFFSDVATYVAILLLLFLNKIVLSFYGGKVRQHFVNPAYGTVCEKLRLEDVSGRFQKGLNKRQIAEDLLESGRKTHLDENESSEEDLMNQKASEEDLFGIRPTSDLKKKEEMGAFDSEVTAPEELEPKVEIQEDLLDLGTSSTKKEDESSVMASENL